MRFDKTISAFFQTRFSFQRACLLGQKQEKQSNQEKADVKTKPIKEDQPTLVYQSSSC